MGCGESKHVVTGNTISRKSSRAGSKRVETSSETIDETTTSNDKNVSKTSSSMLVKEEGRNVNQLESGSGGDNSRAVVAESTTELKKEANVIKNDDQKKNIGVLKENNKELPDDQGNIIASEEIKSLSNENNIVKVADANLEDKKLGQETKLEETVNKEKGLAQETKIDTKNESVMGNKTLGELETKAGTVSEIKLVEETKEKPKEDTLEDKKLAEDAAKEETVKDQKLAEVTIKEETAKGIYTC